MVAKVAGTGFVVTSAVTNGGADNTQAATHATTTANVVAVAQVDQILISPVKCTSPAAVNTIIYLG
jgi:hypothetical protein